MRAQGSSPVGPRMQVLRTHVLLLATVILVVAARLSLSLAVVVQAA